MENKMDLKQFLDAPKNYSSLVPLNFIGYQWLRIGLTNARKKLFRLFSSKPEISQEIRAHAQCLRENGIAEIEEFLSPEEFKTLLKMLKKLEEKNAFTFYFGHQSSGANWMSGPISDQSEEGRWIIDHIARNQKLIGMIEDATGHRLKRIPRLAFQRIEVPLDKSHEDDANCTLHSDRYYSNFKAFLSLDNNDRGNGAYIWCDRSHKMTIKRLLYEYQYSVKESLNRTIGLHERYLKNNRVDVGEFWMKKLNLHERHVEVSKNTLVISNNAGFHKRGTLHSGKTRSQIRINFQYLEQGMLATFLWGVIRLSARLNLLPGRVQNKLKSRGYI
jgi:hypothetical protein